MKEKTENKELTVKSIQWVCSGCGQETLTGEDVLPDQWIEVQYRNGFAFVKGHFCSPLCLRTNGEGFLKQAPASAVSYPALRK